jgi:S1-C subfamily serine protease
VATVVGPVRTALAALAGALIALAIAAGSGMFSGGGNRVVVLPEAARATVVEAPVRSSSLRPGSGVDAHALYVARSPGVVTIYADTGSTEAQGSGFVVTHTGLILTSSHVITDAGEQAAGSTVKPAAQVYVEFADRDRVQARIVGWDVFDDVGVLQVDPREHALAPVPLGSSRDVRVGQPVAVIGSPFGNQNSLDVGVVSGIRRSIDSLTSSFRLADAIQIDAPITHGNSGGPVFEAHGRAIGIAAQIRTDTGQAEGVGFAVPIDSARRSLRQLVTTGKVAYAFAGVRATDVTPSIAHALGLSVSRGALLVQVEAGSAADRAGLRQGSHAREVAGVSVRAGGDVVLAVAGRRVVTGEDLARIVSEELRPGQTVTFLVLRDGRRLQIPVRLGARKD